MKRKISIVIMLIILSFTVISCGAKEYELTLTKNTQIENADDIVMTIKDKSDKELDLVIENKTDDEYVYGYVFELEVEKDENWYRVPFKDNVAFIEIGIILKPKSNNRDGVPIKYVADKLLDVDADIKVLFIISDGKPLAKPNYKDELAKKDLQNVVAEYSRNGINFFVAAIGNDRDVIKDIYGDNKFLDISNINTLPNRVSMILKNLV